MILKENELFKYVGEKLVDYRYYTRYPIFKIIKLHWIFQN